MLLAKPYLSPALYSLLALAIPAYAESSYNVPPTASVSTTTKEAAKLAKIKALLDLTGFVQQNKDALTKFKLQFVKQAPEEHQVKAQEIFEKSFDIDKDIDNVIHALSQTLSDTQLNRLFTWYKSPLGLKITQQEIKNTKELDFNDPHRTTLPTQIDPERLKLTQKFCEIAHCRDDSIKNAESSLNILRKSIEDSKLDKDQYATAMASLDAKSKEVLSSSYIETKVNETIARRYNDYLFLTLDEYTQYIDLQESSARMMMDEVMTKEGNSSFESSMVQYYKLVREYMANLNHEKPSKKVATKKPVH